MSGLMIALVTLLGGCMQWLAWALRVPAILFLLLIGLLLGPVTEILNPDVLIGDLFFPIVSLAVAVILFEGALTLHVDQLKDIGKAVYRLCTLGALLTSVVVFFAAHELLGLGWQVSLLLGAVLVVTGPTVISSMLRNVRPKQDVDRILRWEGIVIDPLGALYAVLLYEAVLSGTQHDVFSGIMFSLVETLVMGLGLGLFSGWLIAILFRRQWVPIDLQKFVLLGVVLFAFSVSHVLQEDSGLLTVTVMGIFLANQRDLDLEPILTFKEDLSLIFISLLFIFLAARVDIESLIAFGPSLIMFLLVVQLIARPISVIASTWGDDKLSWQSKALLCWVAPRGIVAAAVASAFAFGFENAKIPDAHQLVPLTFAVIIFTVVLQSLTAPLLARLLSVQLEHPRTILIIGANKIAREIGKALQELDIPIYLTDPVWENYRMASMNGLPSFYGRAQSEYAERMIPMNQITTVLALSADRNQNALAVQHFAHRFGSKNVFSIRASEESQQDEKRDSAMFRSRQNLFGQDVTYSGLIEKLLQEGRISKTQLSESFAWQDYKEHNKDSIPLFIVDEKNNLHVVHTDMARLPKAGDTVVALAPAKHLTNETSNDE